MEFLNLALEKRDQQVFCIFNSPKHVWTRDSWPLILNIGK